MSGLPSGTVSLLFSDIEGSTLLLNRLGSGYAEALDGHRKVLRKAWADCGGTELGTEGDSFFVVFTTAADAVEAAAQVQRELAEYPWPGDERVQVRIGVHTGSPRVHDGSYVGMDVHRAARIAGAAHGGQVVVSSVAAELARGSLPEGVGLRDLGSHHLKDIPMAEHLFQLVIDGLPAEFPALKTIGAASRLPVAVTPLVGRDAEVAEITALLRSSGVRLVTLMGPGGSGKTRLAIAAAQDLVTLFSDGVFFVPLATVTSTDVMWTSIAEVLDAPPKARTPPSLFDHVALRSALLVLDNLEQLPGADGVVAQLLAAAPRVSIIATSRRSLAVPGEHRYPIPSLTLPADSALETAERSNAVQLFVQLARSIRPDFVLTADNVADVAAICRRLDGLPLAIELSASRTSLLSPRALLKRLDSALDFATGSSQRPSRQKTLRDTIAWSHELLTPAQQAFFRRLAVFAGGCDLDAIAAVTAAPTAPQRHRDPLDMVSELVDASLAAIREAYDGEPRVAMLETIRAFARDQLRAAGEEDAVRLAHAEHYLTVAERLLQLRETNHLTARGLSEIELDNFREALTNTLLPTNGGPIDAVSTGLRLCSALGWLWSIGGYLSEGRRWSELAVERAGDSPTRELADCLAGLANLLIIQGETEHSREVATRSLRIARAVDDDDVVAFALAVLGTAQQLTTDVDDARCSFEEAVELLRRSDNRRRLATTLGNLAGVEERLGNFDRAEALTRESLRISEDLGDLHQIAVQGQNLAYLLAISGRAEEAHQLSKGLVPTVLQLRSPNLTMAFANTYTHILIRLGDPVRAAHLVGAEETMRERNAMKNPHQEEEIEEILTAVGQQLPLEDWNHHLSLGKGESLEELLAQLSTP
jgi:predicted ATPase/class 3 adenylate cyclase